MKVYFDTEFTGLQKDTDLISIGFVSENGKTFYAEFTDYDESKCDDWIQKNVIDNLILKNHMYVSNERDLRIIADKNHVKDVLIGWFKSFGEDIQLVSDVCHYDMVLLIDLFGTAFDLPSNVSASCYDINQDIARYYKISQKEAFDKSREEILWSKYKEDAVRGDKHNALYDAKVIRELYQILNNVKFDNN